MIDQPGRRALVAAASMLATLAGAYQLALPGPAPASEATSARLRPDSPPESVAQLATDSVAAPFDTVAGCLAGPVQFMRGSPASRRPLRVRHYVGTVGGQPATALLQWQNPDSITGRFYLHRRGPAYTLTNSQSHPGHPVLAVYQENPTEGDAGEWRLVSRPGGRLTGAWWGGPPGPPQTVLLRESYAGAVRLAIQASYLRGGWAEGCETGYAECYNLPTVYQEFLQLPAPAAVPLALRPLLSPGAVARRRTTRAARNSTGQVDVRVSVQLNDWNLLSYNTLYAIEFFPGFGTADYTFQGSPLFDLATGQAWPLSRLLQPGYQPALSRLVAQHLLHDPQVSGLRVVVGTGASAADSRRLSCVQCLVAMPRGSTPARSLCLYQRGPRADLLASPSGRK